MWVEGWGEGVGGLSCGGNVTRTCRQRPAAGRGGGRGGPARSPGCRGWKTRDRGASQGQAESLLVKKLRLHEGKKYGYEHTSRPLQGLPTLPTDILSPGELLFRRSLPPDSAGCSGSQWGPGPQMNPKQECVQGQDQGGWEAAPAKQAPASGFCSTVQTEEEPGSLQTHDGSKNTLLTPRGPCPYSHSTRIRGACPGHMAGWGG